MSLIKALRIPEVALMSGFFIIGSFFGIDEWNYNILIKLVMICFISFFTILSVYTYNAAAGGAFTKAIVVTSNATEGNTSLIIKGEVVAKK